jgi:hypothetical protein
MCNLLAAATYDNFDGLEHNNQTKGEGREKVCSSLILFIQHPPLLILLLLLVSVAVREGFGDDKINNC